MKIALRCYYLTPNLVYTPQKIFLTLDN